MKKCKAVWLVASVAAILAWTLQGQAALEQGDEHPWNLSFEVGRLDMEGDQVVGDGFIGSVKLGYDYSALWTTFETVFSVAPQLKGSHEVKYFEDEKQFREVDNLEEKTGASECFAVGFAEDALFHFMHWKGMDERFDPYLVIGVGMTKYSEDINDNNGWDASLRGGAGVMYHFNDEWTLRADFRGFFAGLMGDKGSPNSLIEAGVNWTVGAGVPPSFEVMGGAKDSDADGLTDEEEHLLGTNPFKPDTDDDGLSDFDEVRKYKTDPLNPDTDYDGLKDGPEVFVYQTNPSDRDTDKGGVADGHEVIEDKTDPLNPKDDLILRELYIQFDYDRWEIKTEYFSSVDVIGKMLVRDPGAKVRIEGHADKLKKSKFDHNMKLSERRAQSVMEYLAKHFDVDRNRMEAVGYGYSRPKAANDPVNGNPTNRRVEVYIRPSSPQAGLQVQDAVAPAAAPAVPAGAAPAPADK